MCRIMILVGLAFSLAACSGPDGRVDPLATGLAIGVGALAVGALGYAAGQNSAPRYGHGGYSHRGYGYGGYGHRGYGHGYGGHYRPYR